MRISIEFAMGNGWHGCAFGVPGEWTLESALALVGRPIGDLEDEIGPLDSRFPEYRRRDDERHYPVVGVVEFLEGACYPDCSVIHPRGY